MKQMSFSDRLTKGPTVLMDGAMNTELSRMGLQFNTEEWLQVNCTGPQIIAEIHGNYARAGAEVHIANSFATARHVLADFGLEAEFESLNRAAIEVCREAIDTAADREQWVAGSISTYAPGHDRTRLPNAAVLERNAADQAETLAKAGADLIVLEMVFTVEQAVAMLRGAMCAGLPVSVGFVCDVAVDGRAVLGNSRVAPTDEHILSVADAISTIFEICPPAKDTIVTAMHSELADTGPALAAIASVWDGAKAVYPNTGQYKQPGGWDFDACCSPDVFRLACDDWLATGVDMIGGCCGVGPAHIQALCQKMGARSHS